ncbi:hypothetical protein VPT02_020 [Vibrio phage VPT02]|nr:hypothetical protein VPT02_020 [Vibrio phage VPT02]
MKFDMYCDWAPFGIGVVVVEEGRGVYYNRYETQWTNQSNSCQGELEAINICLDIIDELGLQNVTVHTDHEPLIQSLERGTIPSCKKTRKKTSRANKVALYTKTINRIKEGGIDIVHCKAHSGHIFSNAADVLTRKPTENNPEWADRLRANNKFHSKAKSITKPNPTLWDVVQAWFVNLTYGAVAC